MKNLKHLLLAFTILLCISTVTHSQGGLIQKPYTRYSTYAGNPDRDSDFFVVQNITSSRAIKKISLASVRANSLLNSTAAVYTSGSTYTVPNSTQWVVFNPPSTVASLTITLPAAPFDGQMEDLSFGGTMTAGTVVTTLVVAANSGQGLIQGSAPTTATAGQLISYRYNAATTKWYRRV